jgi:hypothetical protein
MAGQKRGQFGSALQAAAARLYPLRENEAVLAGIGIEGGGGCVEGWRRGCVEEWRGDDGSTAKIGGRVGEEVGGFEVFGFGAGVAGLSSKAIEDIASHCAPITWFESTMIVPHLSEKVI